MFLVLVSDGDGDGDGDDDNFEVFVLHRIGVQKTKFFHGNKTTKDGQRKRNSNGGKISHKAIHRNRPRNLVVKTYRI